MRLLGAAQLIVALLLQLAAVVQLSLSHDDRYVFVASACVGAWTPVLVSLYRPFCALRHQPRALILDLFCVFVWRLCNVTVRVTMYENIMLCQVAIAIT